MQNSNSYKFAIVLTVTLFIISNLTAQNQEKIKVRRPSISTETINRLQFSSPRYSTNGSWQKVGKLDWPWVSPEYITGWQRDVGTGFKAGIYISIFPSPRAFHPNEYKNSLYGDFRKEYNASLSNHSFNKLDGYQSEELQINANCGNGLEFREGYTPTTQLFKLVQLERFTEDSYYEPVLIIVFTAPSAYFSQVQPEFRSFLSKFKIAPLPDRTPPKVDSVNSLSSQTVQIVFDESIKQYDADNENNYSIRSLNILDAKLDDNDHCVILQTTPQADTTYNVIVENIHDISGNLMKTPQNLEFNGTIKEIVLTGPKEKIKTSFSVLGQKSYYQYCYGPLVELNYKGMLGLNIGYFTNAYDSSKVGYELQSTLFNIGLDYTFIKKDADKDQGFNVSTNLNYGLMQYQVDDVEIATGNRALFLITTDFSYKATQNWIIVPKINMGYVWYFVDDKSSSDDPTYEDINGLYNSLGVSLLYKLKSTNTLFLKYNQFTDFQPSTDFDDSYKYNSLILGYEINF